MNLTIFVQNFQDFNEVKKKKRIRKLQNIINENLI